MEKAATGPQGSGGGGGPAETLPVVFTVPRLLYPLKLDTVCSDYLDRPYSLLGYGDVGIPGLLVMLCLRFDRQFHSTKRFRLYYCTVGVGKCQISMHYFVVLYCDNKCPNSICCGVGGDIYCTDVHEDCPTCSTVFGACHSWVCHCIVPAEERISSIFHWKSLCEGIDIQGFYTHQPNYM